MKDFLTAVKTRDSERERTGKSVVFIPDVMERTRANEARNSYPTLTDKDHDDLDAIQAHLH